MRAMAALPRMEQIPDSSRIEKVVISPEWIARLPAEQRTLFLLVLDELGARKLERRCGLGGAFAIATYQGHLRNTKDLDLFVLPGEKDKFISMLVALGFDDFYDTLNYDRKWIYRGERDGVIVDIIWAFPNQRTQLDEQWLSRATEIDLLDRTLLVIPPEELIWAKMYVMQRERCDWPDLLNLIFGVGDRIDWEHLIKRFGNDTPLLASLLRIFCWLCPERACSFPASIWSELEMPLPKHGPLVDRDRVNLLDSRHWFFAGDLPVG